MTQNTSHAVMAQRVEPIDSLDDFPSPPWSVRALCEQIIPKGYLGGSVLEPAANRGYLVKGLKDYFETIDGSDIHDYGAGFPVADFLQGKISKEYDWKITNPPFNRAAEFVKRGCEVASFGVAVLVRASWLEGQKRYAGLFKINPPSIVAQFVERVPMVKGRCDPKASTATAYAWVVWIDGYHSTPRTDYRWIEPCRKKLERPGDYDVLGVP